MLKKIGDIDFIFIFKKIFLKVNFLSIKLVLIINQKVEHTNPLSLFSAQNITLNKYKKKYFLNAK